MLAIRTLMSREGLTIQDAACRHEEGRGELEPYTGGHALVFVRRGCFLRSADGEDALLDPTVAYCLTPGAEQRYDHPQHGGDDCTVLTIDERLLGEFAADSRGLPGNPLPTGGRTDVEQRMLFAAARSGQDEHELFERALSLVGDATTALARSDAGAPQPRVSRARRRLVDEAREALVADPERTLCGLAHELAVSPYHLSRTFRAVTGHTLARHRVRLRTRAALERLAGGERDLARLAADSGFADQSYLCRVIRAETGSTPAALRRALA